MNEQTFKIGSITYIILAILAVILYIERTAFLDISFHLFYILKDGNFAIQNNRFGAFMTQLFPLIGSKIGLPLDVIMKLYSVGFVLYYFSIFLIITKFLKVQKFGIVLLLFSTLIVADTFYWIQSELPQGIAFMILYFATIYSMDNNEKLKNWLQLPVLATMLVTLAFFHPLLIFPFLFSTIFLYLDYPSQRNYLKGGFLFYFFLLLIKSLFFKTSYDSTAMGGIKNFIELFPDYLFLNSNKQFVLDIVNKYYLLVLVFLGMTYYYVKKSKFTKAFLIATFFIGYLLLVNVSYPKGAESFYLENLYLPLSIFVTLPYVFDLKLNNKVYLSLLILILGISLLRISINHKIYSSRVALLENYMSETQYLPEKKIIITEKQFPMDTLMMSWATPYEFWLLSTTSKNETRSIMITDDINEVEWTKNYNKKFVTKWGAFDYSELPTKYFIFDDTTFYHFIN